METNFNPQDATYRLHPSAYSAKINIGYGKLTDGTYAYKFCKISKAILLYGIYMSILGPSNYIDSVNSTLVYLLPIVSAAFLITREGIFAQSKDTLDRFKFVKDDDGNILCYICRTQQFGITLELSSIRINTWDNDIDSYVELYSIDEYSNRLSKFDESTYYKLIADDDWLPILDLYLNTKFVMRSDFPNGVPTGDQLLEHFGRIIIDDNNRWCYLNKSWLIGGNAAFPIYHTTVKGDINKSLFYGSYANRPVCDAMGYPYFNTDNSQILYYNTKTKRWNNALGIPADLSNAGTFANKPRADQGTPVGFKYYCTDMKIAEGDHTGVYLYHKGGDVWTTSDGIVVTDINSLYYKREGTTEERPASPSEGFVYHDTTLNKLIWHFNGIWYDSTGAEV